MKKQIKIPKNLVHELDITDDFVNDVISRYHIQSARHQVDPLISFLYQLTPRILQRAQSVSHQYHLATVSTNVDSKTYLEAEHFINESGDNVSNYLRNQLKCAIKHPQHVKKLAQQLKQKHNASKKSKGLDK